MSDWRMSGADIELLRLACVEARGIFGVRSAQNGIDVAATFQPIRRPDELRCGPVYVSNPAPAGKHDNEPDAGQAFALQQLEYAEAIVEELRATKPAALRILQECYIVQATAGLDELDERGPEVQHRARWSNLVRPHGGRSQLSGVHDAYSASGGDEPLELWLLATVQRVVRAKGSPEEARAVETIREQAAELWAAASREWKRARATVNHRRKMEACRG